MKIAELNIFLVKRMKLIKIKKLLNEHQYYLTIIYQIKFHIPELKYKDNNDNDKKLDKLKLNEIIHRMHY